jgi:cyclic-di-AMP phosphodiesterase PgpH
MFESLRRARLQKAGLSCGKTRLKHQDGDLADELRTHPLATVLVYLFFYGVLLALLRFGLPLVQGSSAATVGAFLYATAFMITLLLHLRVVAKETVTDNAQLLLLLGTLLAQLSANLAMTNYAHLHDWSPTLMLLALPHGLCPMVLTVAAGRRMGLVGAMYGALFGVLMIPGMNPVSYLACAAVLGFTVVALTRCVRRRNQLFMAGLYGGGVTALLSLLVHQYVGNGAAAELSRVLCVPFGVSVLTAVLVGGAMPLLENIFRVTTEISWLELADLNHPLMKRLSIEAPGTYHHSLVMANLAEAAAECIGANAAMTRVCAYFHDIGKLTKPEYFIENMDPAHNPHNDLTARMSALILIAHVKDGVDLAIKHKMNARIIDVIEQHHGNSLAWYFYKRALDQHEAALRAVEAGKAKPEDVPQVAEDVFRYPGPRPQFKESAIISLADAVESASRSLEKPNASRIEALVDEIVLNRLIDGQLDESDLTIAELAKVKASFVKTLLSMMHSRIKYQRLNEGPNTISIETPAATSQVSAAVIRGAGGFSADEPERKRRKTQAA